MIFNISINDKRITLKSINRHNTKELTELQIFIGMKTFITKLKCISPVLS